jgi:predicted GH43/DUF377 family glycosyl hydrolase
MMYRLLLLFLCTQAFAQNIDLEERSQPFVLQIKQIEIPGYPHAFNPSIVRWQERLLLSFRVIPDRKDSFTSWIGLIELDECFNPIGAPQKLEMRSADSSIPCRAEDARLIAVGDILYLIYSDNEEKQISRGGFRVYSAELNCREGLFFLENRERLSIFDKESQEKREKNWVPFDYKGNLLLAYSLSPHTILCPIFGTEECITLSETDRPFSWFWGELRGGTPALRLEDGDYLAFFHSSIPMATIHSDEQTIFHYFTGAYTFSGYPPFALTSISQEPIIAPGFYNGASYAPYWKSVKVIFTCGYLFEGASIFLTYGRDDHEIWIAELNTQSLLESLNKIR